jgi:hypothetical protein
LEVEHSNRVRGIGRLGVAVAGGLLVSLLGPASLMAEPEPTGTLIGTVMCGFDGPGTTTPSALVMVEGTDFSTHSDITGRFTLVVPAMEPLTINAMSGPDELVPAIRADVSVQPGETLDIGNLALLMCPAPTAPDPADVGPSDQQQSVREQLDTSD